MSNSNISITCITENTCLRHDLFAQHGQSLLIKYFDNHYLFDVGDIYLGFNHNLQKIFPNGLSTIQDIVLSHKHLDHTGALKEIIPQLSKQRLFVLEDFSKPEFKNANAEKYKYSKTDERGNFNVGLNDDQWNQISDYSNTIIVKEPVQLEAGLYLTGPTGGKLLEQALVINLDKKGIVVIVGCSHPTLPVLIKKAQTITGNNKVMGVIGGFHFKDSAEDEFKGYLQYLQSLDLSFVAPSHCTGSEAMQAMKKLMPDIVKLSNTGSFGTGNSIELDPALKFNFV